MRKVLLAFVVVLMATAAFVIIDQASARHSRIVGAVFAAIGVPLLVLSRVHLGRAFTIAPKATTLVTRGLYAKVPHPYTDWMKGIMAIIPDGRYEMKAFAVDATRNTVVAYAVFHGTHTGLGDPSRQLGVGRAATTSTSCSSTATRSRI